MSLFDHWPGLIVLVFIGVPLAYRVWQSRRQQDDDDVEEENFDALDTQEVVEAIYAILEDHGEKISPAAQERIDMFLRTQEDVPGWTCEACDRHTLRDVEDEEDNTCFYCGHENEMED